MNIITEKETSWREGRKGIQPEGRGWVKARRWEAGRKAVEQWLLCLLGGWGRQDGAWRGFSGRRSGDGSVPRPERGGLGHLAGNVGFLLQARGLG